MPQYVSFPSPILGERRREESVKLPSLNEKSGKKEELEACPQPLRVPPGILLLPWFLFNYFIPGQFYVHTLTHSLWRQKQHRGLELGTSRTIRHALVFLWAHRTTDDDRFPGTIHWILETRFSVTQMPERNRTPWSSTPSMSVGSKWNKDEEDQMKGIAHTPRCGRDRGSNFSWTRGRGWESLRWYLGYVSRSNGGGGGGGQVMRTTVTQEVEEWVVTLDVKRRVSWEVEGGNSLVGEIQLNT